MTAIVIKVGGCILGWDPETDLILESQDPEPTP